MKRSILYALVAAILLLSMVAACTTPPQQTTVSFMVSGMREEYQAYQSLVEAFQADNPDYRIDLRYVPDDADYRRRLAADFSAGAPPDVMLLNYRRIAPFAAEGALAPIGPYLETSAVISEEDFYQQAINAFRTNGELWCLPQNVSSLVIYYNKTLFDAANLVYPAAGWTWDDFVATARALTVDKDGDGVLDQYGASID
nr:extracellular solute-binding protein [Burkholderiaceae bacterium]